MFGKIKWLSVGYKLNEVKMDRDCCIIRLSCASIIELLMRFLNKIISVFSKKSFTEDFLLSMHSKQDIF